MHGHHRGRGWPFGPRHMGFRRWGPFEFEWDAGVDDKGGPRRRRRGRFGRAELRLLLLTLLAEQPRHGYDLIKAMEELSGGRYSPSPGVVYPALAMLADEGLIAEQASDDQRRKFAVTPAGEKVLADEAEPAGEAMDRLTALGEHADRGRSPSVERASWNLFTAVGQRLAGGRGDEDLQHRIAEILDEAAQRIERL